LKTSMRPPQTQQPLLLQRNKCSDTPWYVVFQVVTKSLTNLHNPEDSLPSRPMFGFLSVFRYFLKDWDKVWRPSQGLSQWVSCRRGTGQGSAKQGVASVHQETQRLTDHLWICKMNTNTVSMLCSAYCI
jgi:hypothetical protein